MILTKFTAKAFDCYLLSIVILVAWQLVLINGSEVKCSPDSKSVLLCEVFESINGTDESITVITRPDQDANMVLGLSLNHLSDAIPRIFFQRFPELSYAEFKDGVETISQLDFKDARNLNALVLEGNRLKIIPKEVFIHATQLDWVDMSSNLITEIEDYAFLGASNVTTLMLNKNNLTIIRRATLAGATSLKRLEVEENQIEVVEEGAFDIQSLAEIFFEKNRVKQLPDNIFLNTPNLEIAYFSSNGMVEIGAAFYNLPKLRSVAFRHSQLNDVDIYSFVKSNPELENMYMEDSGFQFRHTDKLEEMFPNKLSSLLLTNNSISDSNILDYLQPFKGLEYLDIALNNITHIDGIDTISERFPKIIAVLYPGNPINCSWIETTPFDRNMFQDPGYHEFNASGYSLVDGIYCKQ